MTSAGRGKAARSAAPARPHGQDAVRLLPRRGGDGRRDYYVRQLWDAKASVPIEGMNAEQLRICGGVCGWTLARAHARTGDREAIAAYLGSSDRFDRALADFAELYADQNERDHAALAAAVEAGTIAADLDR